jgi:DNA-binding NtrC family response regulator
VRSAGSILIVDDDHAVREAIGSLLAARYAVCAVASRAEAVEALSARDYDLVLLDHCLPDLPGTSLLKLIKRLFPSTMVVLITGYGSEEVAVEALRGGARDYLRKPIRPQDLSNRIASLFELRRAGLERRQNPYVSLHDSPVPAGTPPEVPEVSDRARGVLKAIQHINETLDAPINLDAVARAAGMSKFHFCRRFRLCPGLHFQESLTRRRIARARNSSGTGLARSATFCGIRASRT